MIDKPAHVFVSLDSITVIRHEFLFLKNCKQIVFCTAIPNVGKNTPVEFGKIIWKSSPSEKDAESVKLYFNREGFEAL